MADTRRSHVGPLTVFTEYYRSKTNIAVKIVIQQHKIVIQKQMDGSLYFAEVKCNGSLYFAEDKCSDSCQVRMSPRLQVCRSTLPFQLRWRRLAAAEAGVAAPGAAGMPVRWPRRPAAVSEAVAAGAGPDFSCAAGQKRAAKPPNRRGKVSLGRLCVRQWVCR